MYLDLPQMSRSGKKQIEIPFESGMRASDVLWREFSEPEHDLIMVVVNGEHQSHDVALKDGDTVELLHPMVGG
jgi:molybdopterin converting factor small subunit